MRRAFLAQLSPDDHKYLGFQLWQEGIARYTEIAAAESAAGYHPTEAYRRLPDYEPFSGGSSKLRDYTLQELCTVDLSKSGRAAVYSFGAVEGMLLDHWIDSILSGRTSTSSTCLPQIHSSRSAVADPRP
jgi:hypothetical protein